MFDWVPIKSYSFWYYQIILIFTIFIFFRSLQYEIKSQENKGVINIVGVFLLFFVLFYLGARPINGVFADMKTYDLIFSRYANNEPLKVKGDVMFHKFVKLCSGIMSNKMFFFVCGCLYVVPTYIVSKKWFKSYWVYSFLLLVGSFSFWAYGVNGIRNGIATSFFLMALSSNKKIFQIGWLFLSVNFHSSMYLPSLAFILTWFYNQSKFYFFFWLACIPLSLLLGNFWEQFFAGFVEDDRVSYLTEGNVNNDNFSSTGFRWDFLMYSATGVFAGWYYLYKLKLKDSLYSKVFNIYLVANGFWILVIRANFSNRFAYLSWFLLALVISYLWLKYYFEKEQQRKVGYIILAYIGFTYFMNVIIYKQ